MLSQTSFPNESIHYLFDVVDSISVQGYDEERRVIYWNKGSELLYGFTEEEAIGRKLEELMIPEPMIEVVKKAHSEWLNNGIEIPAAELTLCNKNGKDIKVFSSHALFTSNTNKKHMYCIDINLADVVKAQAKANFKENMLKAVFKTTPDLFFLLNEDRTIIDYHASNEGYLYVSPQEFIGKTIPDIMPEQVSLKFEENIVKVMQEGGVLSFDYELNIANCTLFFEARVSHLPIYNQIVIIVRDITEQHKSAAIIRQQAYYDSLTLLPNRFLSLDRLSQMLKDAERNKEKTSVLILDLDDFNKINDILGHEIGDKILIEAASRMKSAVRKADTVGRLAGDEFIILLHSLPCVQNVFDIAKHLLNIFREPFNIDGRELIVTLSIGVAIFPENGKSASDLLRNADTAMHQAKLAGRNAYSFFTKEMNTSMLRRFEVENQLHNALERNEFEVYYQPKFDVKDGSIVGAEALLRWHNPSLGAVRPDEFIAIAEHNGLIVPIGKYVIQQAFSFLNEWQQCHQKLFNMAINLSPRQFRDDKLIGFIKSSLNTINISPQNIEFEITEGVLMVGNSYIDAALDEFHQLGIKLSMDDFGTGYSSLSYLRQYAFDVLKIDRSFINGLTTSNADCDLVKATIAMAHSLGLQVVAEGVEHKEQLTLLNELKCDMAQGFYFSKAITGKELIAFDSVSITSD